MSPNEMASAEQALALIMEPAHQLELSRLVGEAIAAWAQSLAVIIGKPVKTEIVRGDIPSSASLAESLAEFSVCARAPFKGELTGEVVLLLRPKEATLICDFMLGAGGEGRDAFSADDKATLVDALNQSFSAYATALKQQWGGNLSVDQAGVETEGARFLEEVVSSEVQLRIEGMPEARFIHLLPVSSVTQLLRLTTGESEKGQEPTLDQSDLDVMVKSLAVEDKRPPVPSAGRAAEAAPPVAAPPVELPNLDLIFDIDLMVVAKLGEVEMPLSEILKLGPGSILEVSKLVDEPIDLLVNNRLVARGDVVVVDEKFGVRIVEVVSARERIESLR